MMILWILVLAAIVWLVWMGTRTAWKSGGLPGKRSDSAEELLRERYARSEIDEATYRHMLAELQAR
jgi:uncharacterized membrane protein